MQGMLKRLSILVSIIGLVSVHFTGVVLAESLPARLLITELQTSGELTSDDFVELTNITLFTVDISGWKLQTKSTTLDSDWIDRVVFQDGTKVYPEGSIIVSHEGYLTDIALTHMSFNMAADRGHIRLLAGDTDLPEDTLGWGVEALSAETLAAIKPIKSQSLQRVTDENVYVDTNNNFEDFFVGELDPRSDNTPPAEDADAGETIPDEVSEEPDETPEPQTEESNSEPPEEETTNPEYNQNEETVVLLNPVITELLPDPQSPETDAVDEWVELYNPNISQLNLNGYKLQTGGSFSYNFPLDGYTIEPQSYIIIRSADTNVTLSNSGGAARLVTPDGEYIEVITYSDVETGWGYAKSPDNTWVWTTTPTPAAQNIITLPLPLPVVLKTAATKAAKSTTKATATKKSTTVKTAAVAKKKSANTDNRSVFEEPAALPVNPPIHPVVLVGVGTLAVLYMCYEYRKDFRRFIQSSRDHYGAWRKNR